MTESLSLSNLQTCTSATSPAATPSSAPTVQPMTESSVASHSVAPPTTPTSPPIGSLASTIFRRYTSPSSSAAVTPVNPEVSISMEKQSVGHQAPVVVIGGQNSAFQRLDGSPLLPKPPSILKPSTISGTLEAANIDWSAQPDGSKTSKSGRTSKKAARAPRPPTKSKMAPKTKLSNGKPSKTNDSLVQRPCQAHSFHTDAAEVQKMERELLKLLDDFNSGKLRAFGHECSMEQMEGIRDQQESLARLHFELGAKQELSSSMWSSPDEGQGAGRASVNENNMDRLMTHLERLSVAIGQLNPVGLNTASENHPDVSTPAGHS